MGARAPARPLAFFRHAIAILILPFTVTVLIPVWIASRYGTVAGPGASPAGWVLQGSGLAMFLAGLTLFLASLRRFVGEGDGTLAPWDPPQQLVVRGPYRFVRNPMISGVVFVLAGEALFLRSLPHAIWAGIFLLSNLLIIPLFEEPGLRRRFGEEYREYSRHVPRLLPRLRPWMPDAENHNG